MISTRESIYQAIFNLLHTTPGFNSYWRKYPQFQQLNTSELPALCMREKTENLTSYFAMPPKYVLTIELCIIVKTPTSPNDAVPSSVFNPLLDAIETTLNAAEDVTGRLTLSDPNISRIWIEGIIEIVEAVTEDFSFIYVPIHVVTV